MHLFLTEKLAERCFVLEIFANVQYVKVYNPVETASFYYLLRLRLTGMHIHVMILQI